MTALGSIRPRMYSTDELFRALRIEVGAGHQSSPPVNSPDGGDEIVGVTPGGRNCHLLGIAGLMRRNGLDFDAISRGLHAYNETVCSPPLDKDEVDDIAVRAAGYAPVGAANVLHTLNDVGNAERLMALSGADLRFVTEWGKWLHWNGTYWIPDEADFVIELGKAVAREIYAEAFLQTQQAAREALAGHAKTSHGDSRIKAMLSLARSDRRVRISAGQLDADDWILGVKNGVIDLRTGELREQCRDDLITRVSPVTFDREADYPAFKRFLHEIACRNQSLVDFLIRILGYCLTGSTREQILFFLYGAGANGKTTFLKLLKALLGDGLTKQTPAETLMQKLHGRSATNDLARLEGARVVLANEIEENSFFAESLVKQMTGGDPIPARYLYKEYFEFQPKFKLLIAGNYKPVIKGDDEGIWRRIVPIAFEATFNKERQDPDLLEKLLRELPGILRTYP
jgi:putative DNA primase/helicase